MVSKTQSLKENENWIGTGTVLNKTKKVLVARTVWASYLLIHLWFLYFEMRHLRPITHWQNYYSVP